MRGELDIQIIFITLNIVACLIGYIGIYLQRVTFHIIITIQDTL